MVSRTSKGTKSSLDNDSEHSTNSSSRPLQLQPPQRKITASRSDDVNGSRHSTAPVSKSHYFAKTRKGQGDATDDSEEDSQLGGQDNDDSSLSSSHSDDGGFAVISNDDGGFSVISHGSSDMWGQGGSFRRNNTASSNYGPASGKFRQAILTNRRGSTSMIPKTERENSSRDIMAEPSTTTTVTTTTISNRRGSCSHGSKEDREACIRDLAADGKKKKSLEVSHPRRGVERDLSITSMGSTKSMPTLVRKTSNRALALSEMSAHEPTAATKKKKKNREEEDDDQAEEERVLTAMDKIQAKFLEQRRKERELRLEAAKERIRIKKAEEAQAKYIDDDDDDDDDNEGQNNNRENNFVAEDTKKATKKKKKKKNKHLPPEERMKNAYRWYMRLGMPSQEKLKERIRNMADDCDVHESDVDLLPWIADGRRVNVKQMLMSQT